MSVHKTKILYVDQGVAFGGAIKSLSYLIANLDRTKYTPVLVSEMPKNILRAHMPSWLKVYQVKHYINYSHWMKLNTLLKRRLHNRKLRKTIIYFCSLFKLLSSLIYATRLAVIVRRECPSIIHINNGMEILEANVIALLFGKRCIVHQRGDSPSGTPEKFFYEKTEKFIAVSNHTKGNMISQGIPSDRIVVLFDPTPEPRVRATSAELRHRYGIERSAKCFGIFGRIVDWKGQDIFVKAAIDVLENIPNSYAFIVGNTADGSEDFGRRVIKLARESVVKDRIIFTGYVENVDDYYNMMDLVVHASRTPEPFGMVITEAMALGVPVIATNNGGPLDIIENGVDGILIEPGNAELLAKTIIELLRDDEKRKKMGKKAREAVEKRFSIKPYVQAVDRLYQEILSVPKD